MRNVALIMAGGKGIRFGKDIEKTMIELLGKSLIKRVIEATKAPKESRKHTWRLHRIILKLQKLRRHQRKLLKPSLTDTSTCFFPKRLSIHKYMKSRAQYILHD